MIHLVYPHRPSISAPDVIGHTLLTRLGRDQVVQAHDFDRLYRIHPAPGDILIGHAHPMPWTVFRRSACQPGWARRILLEPYNADWAQVGFIDDVIDDCDLFLAITGSYWFRHASGPTARWKPKMIHLDLAVDRAQFPRLRHDVAPKGTRRFAYVGNDHPGKNLRYLDLIAAAWDGGTIDWIGRGKSLNHVRSLGYVDFSTEPGRQLLAGYDFLITVGNADANPTTVLEAISWGLTPICTPTSGYVDEAGIVNVPGDDVAGACAVLDGLQQIDADVVAEWRRQAERRLATHYNWDRFTRQVQSAITSGASPVLSPRTDGPRPTASRGRARTVARLVARNALYRLGELFPSLGLNGRLLGRARNWLRR